MYKQYHLFLLGTAFIALSAITAILMVLFQGGERERLRTFVESSAIEERLGSVFAAMNDFPGSAGKDMLTLRSLSSVLAFYGHAATLPWRDAHDDLQQFIDRNAAYDEINVYSSFCMFAVRRIQEENGNTSCISPNKVLQDAIAHTSALQQGSVYVSPLVSYARTVKGKESVIPAILYGTKVSALGSASGVIIAVIDANYFLEDVRQLKREGESVFLLNADGSYIANPDATKEKLAGGAANFYTDFPAIRIDTLLNPDMRRFETSDKIFTFMRITPTADNFALYDNAASSSPKSAQYGNSYWIMAAVSDKTNQGGAWWLGTAYLATIAIILLAHVLVLAFLYIVFFPTKTLYRP